LYADIVKKKENNSYTARAAYNLGYMYYHGEGAKIDFKKS